MLVTPIAKGVVMSSKTKKVLMGLLLAPLGLIILCVGVGFVIFPRAELPPTLTEDHCAQYGIQFDTTSIDKLYLGPETVLAAPEKFLSEDPAYLLLGESRLKGASPFQYEAWLRKIENLASQSLEQRQEHTPFRLYTLIMAHRQSFCKEIGHSVLSYLPEGADLGVTIYLTALDEPVPAQTGSGEIAFSLSHPLFRYAALIHEPTGLSTFYNLALQELHHIGFSNVFEWPSEEEHRENEIVIDMLVGLQNDGIATYIEYELFDRYPSPFEYFLYLLDKEPVVRWYIREMNDLFAIAQTRPEPFSAAYDETYRQIGALCYRQKGFYIVGGYMAMRIEQELGREALAQTISGGYETFTEAYNKVAEEDLRIQWK
jgi:hypothetical protein